MDNIILTRLARRLNKEQALEDHEHRRQPRPGGDAMTDRARVVRWDKAHAALLQDSLTEWQFDEIIKLLAAQRRAFARRVKKMKQVSNLANTTEIKDGNLRALLFWAAVGVRNSYAGSYSKNIEDIINQFARALRMSLKRVQFKKAKP